MFWLGSKRGYLSDWITQRWVQLTGRRIELSEDAWLAGPIATTLGIDEKYFESYAEEFGLEIVRTETSTGILPDFSCLSGPQFDASTVDPRVVRFYEQTTDYDLDAWAAWNGFFKPFGWLLARLFSRRLQQLNVPLTGLDTSRGMTSEVLQFINNETNERESTAWFRQLVSSKNVLYAGFYSTCKLPHYEDPCVKVVFPLPNGNAIVILQTERLADGSFKIKSAGDGFGSPGFYFTVHGECGKVWARYVKSLREEIHVFPGEGGELRTDHVLTLFGFTFLRLHYRMRLKSKAS